MIEPVDQSHAQALVSFPERLAESERFHMGIGKVHQALRSLARDLEAEQIPYAVVGGMALNAHGYARETVDVDVLVTKAGLSNFVERYVGRGYRPAFEGAQKSFRNTETGVKVEFLTTGEYPGDGKPKPVAFPDPSNEGVQIDDIQFVSLPRLIELKLASGMTNAGRRRDISDVQDLIRVRTLDERFADNLNPYVRDLYLQLLREVKADPQPHEQ